MTGYDRSQVQARELYWQTMTPPEYVDISLAQIQNLSTTGRIGPYEKAYHRKDGSRSWMLFAGASMGDGTVLECCLDVSDRKGAEDALRKSDEQFRTFVSASSDLVYKMSPGWELMYLLEGKDILADTETSTANWRQKYIPENDLPFVNAAEIEYIEFKTKTTYHENSDPVPSGLHR